MKFLKLGGVIFGAVVITALSIDATDSLSGRSGTLLGQLIATEEGVCQAGMVEVPGALSFTCIDQYEVGVGPECPIAEPGNQFDSQQNLNDSVCAPISSEAVLPWRFVTREQAVVACARAGKRLPSSDEWYLAALGTVDGPECNSASGTLSPAGDFANCASAAGAVDMVGNVWEWVSDDVIDGVSAGRVIPDEGYIQAVTSTGWPTATQATSTVLFADDYVWSNEVGHFGVLRGGYYKSESDGGVYALQAKTVPSTAGTAIGFRCVK